MTSLDQTVFRLAENVRFRSMGDSGVMVATDSGQVYSCNETADAFLKQLDGTRTTIDIAEEVAKEFEVDTRVLMSDLNELVSFLQEENILIANQAPE